MIKILHFSSALSLLYLEKPILAHFAARRVKKGQNKDKILHFSSALGLLCLGKPILIHFAARRIKNDKNND